MGYTIVQIGSLWASLLSQLRRITYINFQQTPIRTPADAQHFLLIALMSYVYKKVLWHFPIIREKNNIIIHWK